MAEVTITGWETKDVRFPTSLDKTGSDAMNAAGDYSAAYCILKTDSKFSGHGMVLPLSRSPMHLLTLPKDIYDWPRERYRLRSHKSRRRPHQGQNPLLPRRELGRHMEVPSCRLTTPLDWT